MRKPLALLIPILVCIIHFYPASNSEAQEQDPQDLSQTRTNSSIMHSWDNQNSYLPPYRPNAYGPGVHSDAAGQAFQYQTQDGQIPAEPLRLRHNALGPGIHMDQYGRTVKPKPYK